MDADKSLPAAEVPLDVSMCTLRISDNKENVAAAEQTPSTTTTKAGNEGATMEAPLPAGDLQMLCDFCGMKCCTCGCRKSSFFSSFFLNGLFARKSIVKWVGDLLSSLRAYQSFKYV